MSKILKYPKAIRRAMLTTAAIQVAEEQGLMHVSPITTAERCMVKTAPQTCRQYFTKEELYAQILADPRTSKKVKDQAAEMGLI